MKWMCPGCGTVHSIAAADWGKWQGKKQCTHCPPVVVTSTQLFDNFKATIEEKKVRLAEEVKLKPEPEQKVVTDQVEQKLFKEAGYEGKKRGGKRKTSW
jgi:hypothetical protein